MCGIAGFCSSGKHEVRYIKAMTEVIRHRGPDDEGAVVFEEMGSSPLVCKGDDTPTSAELSVIPYSPKFLIDSVIQRGVKVALGHRRLSILDLSSLGHQPMCTQDGRYWIVFNGEVYNYIELRAELEKLGHTFISRTDTEVILASYAQWGEECLSRFNGMWAFCIYDSQARTLFLARDRFGVKPFYYWTSPTGLFAFASEIKQFTVLPGWRAMLNSQGAYDFLVFGITDHTEETMFAGVYQLRPGYCVTLSVDNVNGLSPGKSLPARAWYDLRPRPFAGRFDCAVREFRDLFEQSIALRLRADAPIGSCLSGGLDSSSIVCVLNDLLRKQGVQALQKTFSACSDVDRFDERKWIDLVVGKTRVDAHYVYPAPDSLFEESPAITWHQDEPFGSTSIYAQWNVFRLAAQNGVKVILDGQGADEQLCGYHGFFGPRLVTLFRNSQFNILLQDLVGMHRLHGYSIADSLKFMLPYVLSDSCTQLLRRIGGYTHCRPEWLNYGHLQAEAVDPFQKLGAREGNIAEHSRAQLLSSNLQMLLHWEDRDSMAHSIESRVPFLDYRLVEFVLGLPDEFKVAGGMTKLVLRESMREVLPEEIRTRVDKLGFVTPEEVWVREIMPDMFQSKIEQTLAVAGKCFNHESVRSEFAKIRCGKKNFSFWPWRVVNFGEWVQRFGVIS
ncbi:asparagine synthase (glutamine-hydrolyzing) [Desulfomicrobium baculatum]|uniref:asparagine synthase (glutamine-hydrolyzing) n=1 Tax=Desulfomicrobium baculatum (strain DSM 4028 / VKM B-1378 / X) TaxID=525897 RepID=C7LP19_DESBD|nr:asparagine synthase (glutamine-hydrolyzing) [Desulfomicrobium baculatum]ACU91335.1 asparagine synthase (glutamine-hydrolyzing) [Desulfomicrobium baculatum DSM 4028]